MPFARRFRFALAGVTRTTNAQWYASEQGDPGEYAMKKALCVRRKDAFNVYTVEPNVDYYGWGTVPWEYERDPIYDGVVILTSTLPGGWNAP